MQQHICFVTSVQFYPFMINHNVKQNATFYADVTTYWCTEMWKIMDQDTVAYPSGYGYVVYVPQLIFSKHFCWNSSTTFWVLLLMDTETNKPINRGENVIFLAAGKYSVFYA